MALILIVDDEHDLSAMLKFMLEKDGHSVSTACDGVDALRVLGIDPIDERKPVPDLALLDVMLPNLDGYELRARMFSSPRTRLVPIVMLTAKGEMRELHDKASNVAAHVDKPFDPRLLRELIAGMLGGRG
jgi:CheY-like chemotaxis protein